MLRCFCLIADAWFIASLFFSLVCLKLNLKNETTEISALCSRHNHKISDFTGWKFALGAVTQGKHANHKPALSAPMDEQ